MTWLKKLFGSPLPPPEGPSPYLTNLPSPAPTSEKVEFHIRRFSLALEQCQKPDRRAELEKNLTYWQAVKTAQALHPGA